MRGFEPGAENHRSAGLAARLFSFSAQHFEVKDFNLAIKQENLCICHASAQWEISSLKSEETRTKIKGQLEVLLPLYPKGLGQCGDRQMNQKDSLITGCENN